MPRFQLMRGIHNEGGVTYYAGGVEGPDIIDSASDLSKHNSLGIERYKRLPDLPDGEAAEEAAGEDDVKEDK